MLNNNKHDKRDEEIKNICINGTNNRYMMKKILTNENNISKRKNIIDNNLLQNYLLKHEYQLMILKFIYDSFNDTIITKYDDKNELKKYFLKEKSCEKILNNEINKKLSNYKQQDNKKNILNEDFFINYIQVIQKLNNSNLKCHYCDEELFIIYDINREVYQWTLDRINNNIGHTNENTIISCLKCNLKRKNKNKNKFEEFSKLKTIIKSDI
jgi:hypothetical protein